MDIYCPVCGGHNHVVVSETGGLYFCNRCESEIQIHIWKMDQEIIDRKLHDDAD